MSESLAAASILCTRRVALRLGVERQRHFVWGRRPLLVRSSNSEDGAVGDALRETVAVAFVLVTWRHLAFACWKPWWRTQDSDQAKRLRITLVLVRQVAVDVGRDLVS